MRRRFQKINKWGYLIEPLADLLMIATAYVLFTGGYIHECLKGNGGPASLFVGAVLLIALKLDQKGSKDRD